MNPSPKGSLERLINPRTVAIIGASGDPRKTAGKPALYLKKHGFQGVSYLVNPRYESLNDQVCYPSVRDLPETPDVGLILVGPEHVPAAVRELAGRGAAAAVVLAGGYAEIGGVGVERERELLAAAGSMRIIGPNTIGLVNANAHLALSASVALEIDEIIEGHVAVVSQSGGILGSLLSRAAARGVGFSKLLATGNEADVAVTDVMEYLIDDPETSVIALYLEGLRDPARFRELAVRSREVGKPIVVYKVGRSEPGSRSATSHTGALAGSDRAYDAFFEQCGVVRLASFADLIDVPSALALAPPLGGQRLAIVTSTGGGGVLVSDACGVMGFDASPPDGETAQRLDAAMVGDGAVPDRNPIDVTLAGLKPEIFMSVIGTLLESPSYDAVIVIVGSSALAEPDLAAIPVIESARTASKPILVYVSPSAPHIVQKLNRNGVPAFETPEACAAALFAMRRVRDLKDSRVIRVVARVSPADLPDGPLNELESERLFERFGIPAARSVVAHTPEQAAQAAASYEGPVVLKVLSREIAHKTEIGGVVANVLVIGAEDVFTTIEHAVRSHQPDAVIDGILVQEQLSGGVEMILGFTRDPQLGPVILLGAGGVATELFDDTVLRFPPLSRADAESMIRSLKSAPLLEGFRGRPLADQEALVDAILAFGDMVMALGDRLEEAEINPLLVLPLGQGVRAADGLVRLSAQSVSN